MATRVSRNDFDIREMDVANGEPRMLKGRCLCGGVEYEVRDAFRYAMNCHCSNCRRATGSAFKPFAGIESNKLRIVSGQDLVSIYGDAEKAHDVHCVRCGSLLYSIVNNGATAHVTMGTLVEAPAIKPSAHIFVASKAAWHEITDDLPQYSEFPTG
jgi:hypothetical protein